MQRYDSYKDSGIQWLGEIPSHWEVKHLRNFLTIFSEKGHGDKQLLSVTRENGVILRDKENKEENHNFVPDDLSGYKHVYAGDFVINKMKSWQGSYGVSDYEGIVSPAYFTCKLRGVNPKFFSRAIRSKAYIGFFMQFSKGIRVEQWDLDPNSMKDIPFVLPPLPEQQAIASYLDTATAKIDEAIAQQQKMIDLLNERKQIIINNAVTKGLNPNAKMKPSGIDWIGNIPEHWEVRKLKHVTSKIGSGSTPRGGAEVYQDSGVMFLRSQNIYNDGLRLDDVAYIVDDVHQKMKGTQVKCGDILYNITGGSIGRCCCYNIENEANVNQHVSIVRPSGINAKYLMFNLQSDNAQRQLRETLKGGNREGLAAASFKEFLIPTCPKEEQIQIVSQIEKMFVNIDQAIANASKQIALLQERKQIIINDVVTGKVKV